MEPKFSDKEVKDDLLFSLSQSKSVPRHLGIPKSPFYLSRAKAKYCLEPSKSATNVLQTAARTVIMGSYKSMVNNE